MKFTLKKTKQFFYSVKSIPVSRFLLILNWEHYSVKSASDLLEIVTSFSYIWSYSMAVIISVIMVWGW